VPFKELPSNVTVNDASDFNEEGTEIAAMTEVTGYLSSEKPKPRAFKMIVDRPFFFAICEHYRNTILFMGSVEEPGS
jgi:serine protease inhibitor